MSDTSLSALGASDVRETLLAAAAAAATHTLPRFRTALTVDNKWEEGFDPVTDADREAERVIRDLIEARFPDHAIIGEEWAPKDGTGEWGWIIDPIDGTRAFICGVPVWGTLIGLTRAGRAVAGLMAQPFTGETYLGIEGAAHYLRGEEIHALSTSGETRLSRAKLSATSPDLFARADVAPAWERLSRAALQVRYGLDCYAYCLLASGHLDLVVEAGLKSVDIAPLIPIIEGAGGIITTWTGGPAEAGGNCIAAATPALHAEAMAVLAGR
ncbi:histidinol-phosphatase [Arsenicitalea aurantiaca]|uniref:Histidinol-phosphatase n=1 Tax=Arsenicitalea aurantiaca TaxID=1783274 RepID=A0A433XK73_9HYPH|nr:histidinol-phosphatase [Arsenicitalea aurantiaca]RUT34469.1 histidinol-phosphatase [Arsenicitalea aurantiaca]